MIKLCLYSSEETAKCVSLHACAWSACFAFAPAVILLSEQPEWLSWYSPPNTTLFAFCDGFWWTALQIFSDQRKPWELLTHELWYEGKVSMTRAWWSWPWVSLWRGKEFCASSREPKAFKWNGRTVHCWQRNSVGSALQFWFHVCNDSAIPNNRDFKKMEI